jgi:hypothetical protein
VLAHLKLGLMICRDFPAVQWAAALNFAQVAAEVELSAVALQAALPQHSTKKSSCRPLPDKRSDSSNLHPGVHHAATGCA